MIILKQKKSNTYWGWFFCKHFFVVFNILCMLFLYIYIIYIYVHDNDCLRCELPMSVTLNYASSLEIYFFLCNANVLLWPSIMSASLILIICIDFEIQGRHWNIVWFLSYPNWLEAHALCSFYLIRPEWSIITYRILWSLVSFVVTFFLNKLM